MASAGAAAHLAQYQEHEDNPLKKAFPEKSEAELLPVG